MPSWIFEILLKISKPLESAFTSFIVPQNICLDTLIYMILACQDTKFKRTRKKNTYTCSVAILDVILDFEMLKDV